MRVSARVLMVLFALSTVAGEAAASDRPGQHHQPMGPKARKTRGVPELGATGAGGAAVLVAGAAWLVLRRRRENDLR